MHTTVITEYHAAQLTKLRTDRIFTVPADDDEWGHLIATFTTWESAFWFAFTESALWRRRMMVIRSPWGGHVWLVYPAAWSWVGPTS